MGLTRRENRDDDRQIDWIALLVMMALGIAIFLGLNVIAKYIFG
jgi:hypothetical protein